MSITDGISFGLIVFAALMLWRNQRVYEFRSWLIDTFAEAGRDKDESIEMFLKRSKTYNSVSYYEMMVKFWKPLKPEAWYEDTSFLEEGK